MTKIFAKFKEKPQWVLLSLVFLLAGAFTRFLMLDNKPIHFDESINMWFVQRIWEDGFFRYDPTNYHGPLLFYLIQFVQLFTGFDFVSTRWVATFFSFFTLVALWFGPQKERVALRWAAVFLLFSPAMGFYGRSGIHESAFVFFQVLGFLSFHYLVAKDFRKFWWAFAASLLGMMALKETFVILILAFIPAALMVYFSNRKSIKLNLWWQDLKTSFVETSVAFPLLAMLLVFIGVYSGFGGNPKGLLDFFIALMPWLKTGVHGAGHEKSFWHWSELMGANEFAIVAGFFVGLAFVVSNKWLRFYVVFTFFLWLIYSLIPYKTPWCLISILWPFAIVAGFAMDEVWKRAKSVVPRVALLVLLTVLFVSESLKMYQVMYKTPIDMSHPFVYVNSTYQLKEFVTNTQNLIRQNPLLREEMLQIGIEESWPFPIVFYNIYKLSYFRINAKVEDDAMIYLVDQVDRKVIEENLKKNGKTSEYGYFFMEVRQGRAAMLVYAKKSLFAHQFSWDLKDIEGLH